MKLQITFQEANSDYSQDYAYEYQFGKESLDNEKYNWSNSFELEDIDKVEILNNQIADYIDKSNKLENLDLIFEKLAVIQCIKSDKVMAQYGVSDELLKNAHKIYKKENDTLYYYFTLKDKLHFHHYEKHIYVLIEDIKRI